MLFKILHGDESRISTDITPYHEGYCYVTHNGCFYVDMNNERVKLNANEAEKLVGYDITTTLNSSDAEIPTSKTIKTYVDNAVTNAGSNVELDTTLTQSGKAADAKSVGDALAGKANTADIPTKVSDLTNDKGFITSYTETDPTVPAWAKASTKPSYTAAEVGALPSTTKIPTKVSELANDSNYLTSYTETDPTVPAWAKAATKPTYTASEVGALPDTTEIPDALADLTSDATHRLVTDTEKSTWNAKANTADIPTKTSDLTNDSGFITGYTETDPTVPSWAKASTKPSYTKSEVGLGNVDNVKQYSASNPPPYPVTSVNDKTGAVTLSASDVGADASGTASSAVSAHNTNTSAHADIREQINQLSSKIVDETTIQEMIDTKFNSIVNGNGVAY